MHSTFSKLAPEIRQSFLQYLNPPELFTMDRVSTQCHEDVRIKVLWRQYLKPEFQDAEDPKAAFIWHVNSIAKEYLPWHALGNAYQELLDFKQREEASRTLGLNILKLKEKALKTPQHAMVTLSNVAFWQPIQQHLADWPVTIKEIACLHLKALRAFLRNDKLLGSFLQSRKSLQHIEEMCECYPELNSEILANPLILNKLNRGKVAMLEACNSQLAIHFTR